jgi:hypothetical protein
MRTLAQVPLSSINYTQTGAFNHYTNSDSNNSMKKWSLSKYGGISASYGFFNGGNATVFSAPIGLQLNRRLNNNLYAFAGISAAPAFVNFNQSFIIPDMNKYNTSATQLNANGFSLYSKFEAGLMYINNDRTFSISGSIGVYKSSYPAYPPYNMPNPQKQQPVTGSRQ